MMSPTHSPTQFGSCRDGLASPLQTLAPLAFATGTQGRLGLGHLLRVAFTWMWTPSQNIYLNFVTPSLEGVTSHSSRANKRHYSTTHHGNGVLRALNESKRFGGTLNCEVHLMICHDIVHCYYSKRACVVIATSG